MLLFNNVSLLKKNKIFLFCGIATPVFSWR
jgi:hypothetical protein